jgi:hypothetical protein
VTIFFVDTGPFFFLDRDLGAETAGVGIDNGHQGKFIK